MNELDEMQDGGGRRKEHGNPDAGGRSLPEDLVPRQATWREYYYPEPGQPQTRPITLQQLVEEVKV